MCEAHRIHTPLRQINEVSYQMTEGTFAPKQKADLAVARPAPAGSSQDAAGSQGLSPQRVPTEPGARLQFTPHAPSEPSELGEAFPAVRSGHSETSGDGATAGLHPLRSGCCSAPTFLHGKPQSRAAWSSDRGLSPCPNIATHTRWPLPMKS